MSDIKKILNADQQQLVNEFVETYGIEPEDILFLSERAEPFLTYEATCAVAHQLIEIASIEIEQSDAKFEETIAAKCSLIFGNGKSSKAVGIHNYNETINDESLNDIQGYALASARAVRNALRAAGIDLFKLHRQNKGGENQPTPKSLRTSLIGQAHLLGIKVGFILGGDKTVWRTVLSNRYGVNSSAELTEEQLSDLVAFLNGIISLENVADVKQAA